MDGLPAEHDAPVVRKLREAGAIILGKTVTTQFACFDPPPTAQSVEPRADTRRLIERFGRRSSRGNVPGRDRIADRRIDHSPRVVLRRGRLQADLWSRKLRGVVPVAPSLDTVGPIAGCVADLAIMLNAISSGNKVAGGDDPALKAGIAFADLEPQHIKPPRLALLTSRMHVLRVQPDDRIFLEPDGGAASEWIVEYFQRLSGASMWLALT